MIEKKIRCVYWGNVKNCPQPTEDQKILKALKEVAEVQFFDIKNFNMKRLIEGANASDLFLFHAQVPTADEVTQMLIVERIQLVLRSIKCKKVLWFMEKVWLGKANIIDRLLPEIDCAFFTDETWVRRMKDKKIHALHPASSIKSIKGRFKPELVCDIAYIGQLYGVRPREYEFLKEKLGDAIKFYDNKFGQDLAYLCKSAKIILTPRFPFDDFFWSDRIYTYLSYGALTVHQRSYGLKEEGFEDGKHYFEYERDQDLLALLGTLLEKGAEKTRSNVAKQGQEFVKKHTYRERITNLLKVIKNEN